MDGLTLLEAVDKNSKKIELIQIFREKISKVDNTRHQKDSTKAAELRKKGNDLFARGVYEDACEWYTQGCLHAPLDDPKCDEFALCIANRSACYFHLKKYQECITDVDLAIAYRYPVKSRVKLIARKASCENELKKLITHNDNCKQRKEDNTFKSDTIKESPDIKQESSENTISECDLLPSGPSTPSSSSSAKSSVNDVSSSTSNVSVGEGSSSSQQTHQKGQTGTNEEKGEAIVEAIEEVNNEWEKSVPSDSTVFSPSFTDDGRRQGEEAHQGDLQSTEGMFKVETITGRGKSLVAKESISAGSMVLSEKAFMTALHPNQLSKYCYHCLKRLTGKTAVAFPCKSCTQVKFCSMSCSSKAYNQYHKMECGLIELLNISPEFHYSPKITLKTLAQCGISQCLSHNETEKTSLHDLTHGYSGFFDMIEHTNEDPNDYTLASSLMTALLVEKMQDNLILGKSSIVKLSERIMKHLRQVNVNAITITSKEVIRNDEAEAIYSESTVGVGVYLTTRLVNHSCDPNCRIIRFDQDTLHIMATRDIEEGEELTISYGGSYRWQLLTKRKEMLKQSYFFDCQCSACHQGLQPLTTALRCSECFGPVISDGKMVCLGCKKEDHIDVKEVIDNTAACLKVVQMAEVMMENKGAKEVLGGNNNFDIAEKTLQEAADTLSKVVYRTHSELSKIWEKQLTCFLRLKKYRSAVEVCEKTVDNLRSQYHDTYYKIFNYLLTLVKCQSLYYKQLKSTTPIDKNELNLIKTNGLRNIDLLDELYNKISSGDDSVIRERIMSARRLFCPPVN